MRPGLGWRKEQEGVVLWVAFGVRSPGGGHGAKKA